MVRNAILIFCLCVCFCQYHISVSLCTHLYTHIINKLLHGWFVCTIFIIHSLWRIAKLTRSLLSLVRLTILHNSWIKIVRTHQPWSNLYMFNLFQLQFNALMDISNVGNLTNIASRNRVFPPWGIYSVRKRYAGIPVGNNVLLDKGSSSVP